MTLHEIDCPSCDGQGKTEQPQTHPKTGETVFLWVSCPQCHGRRTITDIVRRQGVTHGRHT